MSKTNCKLVLVGDGGVGKTAYVKRMLTGQFEQKYIPTLGVEVHPTEVDGVMFHFWDVAGQEKLSGPGELYFTGAKCAMVMFDLGNELSFQNAKEWAAKVERIAGDVPMVLVGNKCDCEHKVSAEAIADRTWMVDAPYYEISVKLELRGELSAPLQYLISKIH
jgi:GTP-binding nuclear protein Ran